MLDLTVLFDLDLKRRHEERVQELAYDYQQGLKTQRAIAAFARQRWQRILQTVNGWRNSVNSGPRTPELHY